MSATETKVAVDAAIHLGTLIDAHARDAGRQLGERLCHWLQEREALPDFTLALELPARMVRQAGQDLHERQKELDDARSRERQALFRRDQTAAALRRKLVDVRRLLSSALGPRRTKTLLGIEGDTAKPSQPALLLSQADAFLKLLRNPRRLAIPHGGSYFDPAAVADDLEPLASALRGARDHLDENRRASAQRLEARDRQRAELTRAVQCVASIASGWFRLIRRDDLVKKLRPA